MMKNEVTLQTDKPQDTHWQGKGNMWWLIR